MTQAFQISPGQVGDTIRQAVWAGGRETHNSDTPLVVGSFAFNPSDYSIAKTTVTFEFVAIAATGTSPLTAFVQLYNVTDAQYVTSSLLTIEDQTAPTKYSSALVVGAGASEIKLTEKIYECRVFLDDPAVDEETDTIELYKAEIRAVFTVV